MTLTLLARPCLAQEVVESSVAFKFPAGSPSQLVMTNDHVAVVLNSWSRGDGMLVFHTTGDQPVFRHGIMAHGYSFRGATSRGRLYAANWFSMSVSYNGSFRYNMLHHFPQGSIYAIAAAGDRLYLGDRVAGLRVFDITQEDAPVLFAWQPEAGSIQQILASPSHVVILTRDGHARIGQPPAMDEPVDFHTTLPLKGPAILIDDVLFHTAGGITRWYKLPSQAGEKQPEPAGELPSHQLLGDAYQGRLLLKTADDQLQLMEVTQPDSPRKLRTISFPQPLPSGDHILRGDHLFIFDKPNVILSKWDISGEQAHLLGQTPIMRNAGTFVVLSDFHALLQYNQADQNTLLGLTYDVKRGVNFDSYLALPLEKRTSFRHYSQQRAAAMVRLDDRYVLTGDGLVDISNPRSPQTIHPPRRTAASIQVEDGVAYLASNTQVAMLDVSNLPQLKQLGVYQAQAKKAHFVDIVPHGEYVYVLDNQGDQTTLQTLDVSDKARPTLLGSIALPDALAMVRQGDRLYAATANNRVRSPLLHVVDLTNPREPRLIRSIENILQGDCYRARVVGSQLFLVDDGQGILQLNLADPDNPSLIRVHAPGDGENQPAYTDFDIHQNILYGMRFSAVDRWELAE